MARHQDRNTLVVGDRRSSRERHARLGKCAGTGSYPGPGMVPNHHSRHKSQSRGDSRVNQSLSRENGDRKP